MCVIFNSSHVGRRSVQVLGFLWGWGLHIFRIIYIHLLGRRNFGMCYGASCRSLYEMKVLLQNLKKEIMTISSTWFVKMCMHSIFSASSMTIPPLIFRQCQRQDSLWKWNLTDHHCKRNWVTSFVKKCGAIRNLNYRVDRDFLAVLQLNR